MNPGLIFRLLTSAIFGLLLATACFGQPARTDIPEAEKGTGVDENLGDTIDLGIQFRNDKDSRIELGDLFDGKRPVILSFNYSNCPKLCSVQLENMAIALRKIDFKIKEHFQVVSVCIDPLEQVATARKSKEKFVTVYGDRESSDGWHFLTGDRDGVEVLADNCGVRYKYIPHQKLYSHPPVFILLSPKGKVVRYIHGLNYEPITIKRALVEAAEGKIGSSINRFTYITGCYLYDETSGKYSPQAMGLMRIGGAFTVIVMFGALIPYWFLGAGRKSKALQSFEDNEQETPIETNDESE